MKWADYLLYGISISFLLIYMTSSLQTINHFSYIISLTWVINVTDFPSMF